MALDSLEANFGERALEEPDESCDSADTSSPYDERLLQPDQIRLLTIVRDTDTLRLTVTPHKFQDGLQYDAVSYVWGAAEASMSVPCNGKNITVTPTVFEMLQHLSPYRSYWLDSICINQQDSEEKAVQIPLMHRIYSLAAFVVIWMGLPTAQSEQFMLGFSNALKMKREWNSMLDQGLDPFVQKPDLFCADETFWLGMIHICKHEWFKRLWTFQEAVLARQPIMLLGPFWLKFEEFLEFIYEGWHREGAYMHSWPRLTEMIKGLGGSLENLLTLRRYRKNVLSNGAVPINQIPYLLHALRDRHVREPVDRAWAITGLLSYHLRSKLEPDVDYSDNARVDFWETHIRFARTIIAAEQSLCLLTIPSTIEGRPQSSPSWCPALEGVPACGLLIVGAWADPVSGQEHEQLLQEIVEEGVQEQQSSDPKQLEIPFVSRRFISFGKETDYLHTCGHLLDTISEVVGNQELTRCYEYVVSAETSALKMSNPVHAANVDVCTRSLQLACQTARSAEVDIDSVPPEYLMALLMDTRISREAAIAYKDGWNTFRDGDLKYYFDLPAERKLRATLWLQRLQSIAGYSFFSTTGGRFGITTPGCKPGDKVCVFYSERPLHILRWPEPEHEPGALHGEGPAEFCGVAFVPHPMKPDEQEAARLGPDEIFVIG